MTRGQKARNDSYDGRCSTSRNGTSLLRSKAQVRHRFKPVWYLSGIMDDKEVVSFSNRDVQVWPDILESMYSTGGTILYSERNETDEDSGEERYLIYDQFAESQADVQAAIGLLKRAKLVEKKTDTLGKTEITYLQLTKRGFEVAHEREVTQEEQETNDNLAFFTLILGFAAIVQSIAAVLQLENPSNQIGLLLVLLAITMMIMLYQSEPFEWFKRLFGVLRD